MRKVDNMFFYNSIAPIGGIEEFLYQIAKIYKDRDILVLYNKADEKQVKRLQKYVHCRRYRKGETIKCKRAFFNYHANIIDNVEAEEKILLIHADFVEMINQGTIKREKIPSREKIDRFIAVSQKVADSFEKLTGIKPEVCYNPFRVDKPKKLLKLISTTRLSEEKGWDLMQIMADAMNEYCEINNCDYIWYVLTADRKEIDNDRIVFIDPRLNVEGLIKDADYLVQLSKHEAFCYAIVKALCLGTPCIVTDLPVFKEIGVNEENSIIVDRNLITVPAKEIFERKLKFKYTPPHTNWDKILVAGTSKYEEDMKPKYLVEALRTYQNYNITDTQLGHVPVEGERFMVNEDRLNLLLGENDQGRVYVKLVEGE